MKAIRRYSMDVRADGVEATRQRILDVARQLFMSDWYDDVTLNAIAAGAGVSHQTVLNHFGSKEGVFAAMSTQIEAEYMELRDTVAPGNTAEAVAVLLDGYEREGLANVRAVYQEDRVPPLKGVLDRGRGFHRAWVERVFAHALPASGPARRQKVAAFIGATEVLMWKSLRHDYGFSKRDTTAAITALITALEAQP
jgi:AcrR family transcriptional regulator